MSSIDRTRRSSGKGVCKEKVVLLYERFFTGEDISSGSDTFWEDFFLLRTNVRSLQSHFEKRSSEELMCLAPQLNRLFEHCVAMLHSEHAIRRANAALTLSGLVRGVLGSSGGSQPPSQRSREAATSVLHNLVSKDAAEISVQELISCVNDTLLREESHTRLRNIAINLLLTIVTAYDDINYNPLMEFILLNSAFESLTHVLSSASLRLTHGRDACILLSLLLQCKKYESTNPYVLKLSLLDDDLALNGFSYVVSVSLAQYNEAYRGRRAQPKGFLSSISNMVGNILVGEEKYIERLETQDALLLALYEAIHVNRNFITTLTYAHTPTSASPPSSPPSEPAAGVTQLPVAAASPESTLSPAEDGQLTAAAEPTNLLVVFLEYCSIVMQDTRDVSRYNSVKLCFLILTCVAEDQYANSLMHDMNMNFRVHLHRIPMRHRKPSVVNDLLSRPLSCALLDLMVEFMQSHLMKSFPLELYSRAAGVIHRLLCYQKKCKVRIHFSWPRLWSALFSCLKFVVSQEQTLARNPDTFSFIQQVVNIFNLFITFGDTFLHSPLNYDELFYELIRMNTLFDNLHALGLRFSVSTEPSKEKAGRLVNALANIRSIIKHFTPKIDSWAEANGQSSLTSDQVLDVVRNNYDSLTLKLQDNLDVYERYKETSSTEKTFFTNLVQSIVLNLRKECFDSSCHQQRSLGELSTIT